MKRLRALLLAASVVASIVLEYYLLDFAFHGSVLAGTAVVLAEFVATLIAAFYALNRKDASVERKSVGLPTALPSPALP